MPPPGTVSAVPSRLADYARTTGPAGRALLEALAGLPALVAGWNARPSAYGGRLDEGRLADLTVAAAGSVELDAWVARVGRDLAVADRRRPLGPAATPPSYLAGACPADLDGPLVEVVRDGADGRTRLVRLDLDRLPTTMTPDRWQHLLTRAGLGGGPGAAPGPVHLVVHGWGATTGGATGAGEATADLYDQAGRAATVVVVDWEAGRGSGAGWWRAPSDFRRSVASAGATGEVLAEVLTALAALNPDASVAVVAHSLGNDVAARALTRMRDPSGRFSVDYLAIQAAIPARAPLEDPDDYGALAGPRIRELTVTINAGDDALFWYELQGPEALGDEAIDGEGITTLRERRREAGLDTAVIDHDSEAGRGHLGLRPSDAQPLVRHLTQAMIDRGG